MNLENNSLEMDKGKRISFHEAEDDDHGQIMENENVCLNVLENDAILNSMKPEFEDLDYDPMTANIVARAICWTRRALRKVIIKHKMAAKVVVLVTVFLLCNAYLTTALAYNRRNSIDWDWCDGHGLLIILVVATYWGFFYYHIIKRFFGRALHESVLKPLSKLGKRIFSRWYVKAPTFLILVGGVAAFIVVDAWNNPKRLISAGGAVVMLVVGLLFSQNPGRVQWRPVFGGIAVQFILGLVVIRWEAGRNFLECVSKKVTGFLSFADDGSSFIYGYLSYGNIHFRNSSLESLVNQTLRIDPIFAFQALSVTYFFSFVVGLLYHIGVMTWVVMKVGWMLQVVLGTTAAESMNASANIFLGQTEAPILIKPFLNDMTRSEIHAVMTGGFATIAGSLMAAYVSFGVNPSSLLTASVMAAPAALAFSKLLYPETQKSKTSAKDIKTLYIKSDGNALDAAAQGAVQGFILIGNIIANMIAVIAFISFLSAIVGWLGTLVGQDQLSFEWILGKVFIPVAICLGVDSEDVEDVALLLGLRLVVNDMVAYQKLVTMTYLSPRSRRIAEYALCSFANLSSIGIQLGGLGALSPLRRTDFSKVVWSAFLAGTLTCFMNACVAGALLPF